MCVAGVSLAIVNVIHMNITCMIVAHVSMIGVSVNNVIMIDT